MSTVEDVAVLIQRGHDRVAACSSPEHTVEAVRAALRDIVNLPSPEAAVFTTWTATCAFGVASFAAFATDAAQMMTHRYLLESYASLTVKAVLVLYVASTAEALDQLKAAVHAAAIDAGAKSASRGRVGISDEVALLVSKVRSSPHARFAGGSTAVMTALRAVAKSFLGASPKDVVDIAESAAQLADVLAPSFEKLALVAAGPEEPRQQHVVATPPLESASANPKVLALLEQQQQDEARLEQARDASRNDQSAALQAALEARKRRKGASPQPSTTTQSDASVLVHVQRWMCMTDCTQHGIITDATIVKGAWEKVSDVHVLCGELFTCAVHATERLGDTAGSAHFSLRALAHKLYETSDGSRGAESIAEWIEFALALAEVFIDDLRDFSHAEHLLAAVRWLLDNHALSGDKQSSDSSTKGSGTDNKAINHSAPAAASDRSVLHDSVDYIDALFTSELLKLLSKIPPSVPAVSLFRNPAYPPEELASATADVIRSGTWGGCMARVAIAAVPIPLPRSLIPLPSGSGPDNLVEVAKPLHDKLTCLLEHLELRYTVDTNCERFVKCARARANGFAAMFDMTHDTKYAAARIATLDRLRRSGLDGETFRNVLRQCEFDMASTYFTQGTTTQDPTSASACFRAAEELFGMFGNAFQRDFAKAAKAMPAQTHKVIESSDVAAYLLATSRRAQCLTKLGDKAAAKEVLTTGLKVHRSLKVADPEIDATVKLMAEMCSLL
jgi:hypothetical protein